MLKKELMKPGVRIIVNDVIKDGLPSLGPGMRANETKPHLSIYTEKSGGLSGGEVAVNSRELLIIEKPPRKVRGVNLCRVRRGISQTIGEVYWCELRASCRMEKLGEVP